MQYSLIMLALLVMGINSHAGDPPIGHKGHTLPVQEEPTPMEGKTLEQMIGEFYIASNNCAQYVTGSYTHTDDSDIPGEQLAAISCVEFMGGYYALTRIGVIEYVTTHPYDEAVKGQPPAEQAWQMYHTYQMIIRIVWPQEDQGEKPESKPNHDPNPITGPKYHVDGEDKDTNSTM